MRDFSAAAILRLIALGLSRQGIALPSMPTVASAQLPLGTKRNLTSWILKAHGPLVLLRIGEAVSEDPEVPIAAALQPAQDPHDLVARWRRLERYVHSRHRTRILQSDRHRLVLRHRALAPFPPPTRDEDLLIFGLLTALVDRTGAVGLRARIDGAGDWQWQGAWRDVTIPEDPSVWILEWSGVRPANPSPPVLEDNVSTALSALVAADPGRTWTVDHAARALAMSARSLQRRLRQEGTTFSMTLASARASAAAKHMQQAETSLAEIGFACGYADQAHFSRDFKRVTALTPSDFRAEFADRP